MTATLTMPAATETPKVITRDCETCDGTGEIEVRMCNHSGNCPCGGAMVICGDCEDGQVPVECGTCGDEAVHQDANGAACLDCGVAAGLIEAPADPAPAVRLMSVAHITPRIDEQARAEAVARQEAAAAQRAEWRRQGLRLPYAYNKPVELGGFCVECEADHGGHYRWCGAVD